MEVERLGMREERLEGFRTADKSNVSSAWWKRRISLEHVDAGESSRLEGPNTGDVARRYANRCKDRGFDPDGKRKTVDGGRIRSVGRQHDAIVGPVAKAPGGNRKRQRGFAGTGVGHERDDITVALDGTRVEGFGTSSEQDDGKNAPSEDVFDGGEVVVRFRNGFDVARGTKEVDPEPGPLHHPAAGPGATPRRETLVGVTPLLKDSGALAVTPKRPTWSNDQSRQFHSRRHGPSARWSGLAVV